MNHLPLLRSKDEIALLLRVHPTQTPTELYEANFSVLEAHNKGKIKIEEAMKLIAHNTESSFKEINLLLNRYFSVGHLEFHPTDRCNLKCRGCTYGQDDPRLKPLKKSFPFEHLDKVAELDPRSLLLSGGGEPTLYRYKGHVFRNLVERLHELMPNTPIALITNGTCFPKGRWTDYIKWVRISVDAATPACYRAFKGRSFFNKVAKNLLNYLDSSIPSVGCTFLFSKENINEYVDFSRHFLDYVQEKKPKSIDKFNISYRPLRQNPNDDRDDFPEALSDDDIKKVVQRILNYANTPQRESFFREQSNVEAVMGGNLQPAMDFERCHYSQIFHIIRANGDVRPCFTRVLEPDFKLGNVIKDSHSAISLNTLYIGTRRKRYCDSEGCRQCHINYLLEKGLKGEIKPSKSHYVFNDPFF